MQMFSQVHIKTIITLPGLALMLTLAMLPLLDAGFDHQVIYWILFLLLAGSITTTYRENWHLKLALDNPLLWYFIFVFWGGISIFWSLNPHRTLVEFLQIACYGLVFFLALRLNEDNIFRVGRIAFIAGVGVALFGISQHLFLKSSRIQATFTNANPLGIYLVMLFFLGWAYYLRRPNRWLAAGCLVLLVALALTGSRGSFICFLFALPLIFLRIRGKDLTRSLGKTALCIAVALVITQGIMVAAPYLQERIGSQRHLAAFLTRPETFITSSGEGRFAFWQVGGRLALNEPLTGYGLGTYHLAYYLEYLGDRWYARFAHNHYLQVLAELGLAGFGLLAGFLVTSGKKIWQWLKQEGERFPAYYPGLIAVTVAFLLHIGGDFSWNFPGSAVLFFAAVGVAVGSESSQVKAVKRIGYKYVIGIFSVLLILTIWQFTANIMYRQGIRLDSRGEITEAALVYDRANTLYPINSMAYSFSSRNYLQLAQENEDPDLLEKALVSAQRAVTLSPVDGNLHNNLGRLYWQMGKLEEAEEHLVLAVDYAAYRLKMFLDLGFFYLQQGRTEEAEAVLLSGLNLEEAATESARGEEGQERVETQLLQMHLLLGRIYFESGEQELADQHMQEAKYLHAEHPAVQQYFEYFEDSHLTY